MGGAQIRVGLFKLYWGLWNSLKHPCPTLTTKNFSKPPSFQSFQPKGWDGFNKTAGRADGDFAAFKGKGS